MSSNGLSVYNYSNFRDYLRDVYTTLKKSERGFSFREFSKVAGFSSPNFLKLVIDGKRNLSTESIGRIAHSIGLSPKETEFFRNLVLLNQSQSLEERQAHSDQLVRSKAFRKLNPMRAAQHHYYSAWYHVPIRELVAVPDFQEDPHWIASRLNPPITPAEAQDSLKTLLELNLIRRDESGRLVQTDQLITTGDEVSSASVGRFHREMLRLASESIERFPSAERDVSTVTLGLSPEGQAKVKTLIQEFRKQLMAIAEADSQLDRVVQLNFQLFPLTQEKLRIKP